LILAPVKEAHRGTAARHATGGRGRSTSRAAASSAPSRPAGRPCQLGRRRAEGRTESRSSCNFKILELAEVQVGAAANRRGGRFFRQGVAGFSGRGV